jgi:hypothetical protein
MFINTACYSSYVKGKTANAPITSLVLPQIDMRWLANAEL